MLISVAVPHVKNVQWWGCVFAVLDRCKYYAPACPSVWSALSHLVLSRSLIPQNFALCLRFLLQLTHLNTPHQAVGGMAAAILAHNAPLRPSLPSSASNPALAALSPGPPGTAPLLLRLHSHVSLLFLTYPPSLLSLCQQPLCKTTFQPLLLLGT